MSDFEHEYISVHVSNMDVTRTPKSLLRSGELSIADNAIGSGLKTRKKYWLHLNFGKSTSTLSKMAVNCE